jgi:hypothetical protein
VQKNRGKYKSKLDKAEPWLDQWERVSRAGEPMGGGTSARP